MIIVTIIMIIIIKYSEYSLDWFLTRVLLTEMMREFWKKVMKNITINNITVSP